MAKERDINLTSLHGSGPRGRIHVIDIPPLKTGFESQQSLTYESVRLEGMRKTIAQKMVASYQTIPHINFTIRVNMSSIEKARQQANIEAQRLGFQKVTITAFFVLATARALKQNPYLNSSFTNEEIHLLHDINIGVAVALENGLIVPVIHGADRCSLQEISNQLNDITARARVGKLIPMDVSGGTFTISNLGPYGIEQFTAIINPPQTAILAAGVIQQEVIPDQNGQISVKPMAHLTLSTDHRVIDGAMAARFLQDLKSVMENELK
jgi:pyruvate dehydrogenase E2 component (dihydrolipoamide acetyltransferase)